MSKTKILLSTSAVGALNYINAVEGVGAVAVAKYLPKVDTGYDGLILCGAKIFEYFISVCEKRSM